MTDTAAILDTDRRFFDALLTTEPTTPDGTQVNAASRYTHVFVAQGSHSGTLVSAQGTGIS